MTISYHLYFLCVSKVWSMSNHWPVGQVLSKECYFVLACSFLTFFVVFIKKIVFFFHFHFFFWQNIKFLLQGIKVFAPCTPMGGDNTNRLSNSNISKTVRVNNAFTTTFFEKCWLQFSIISRLIDLALVVL